MTEYMKIMRKKAREVVDSAYESDLKWNLWEIDVLFKVQENI